MSQTSGAGGTLDVPADARGGWAVDPLTIGAVLAAVVSGAGGQAGSRLLNGVVSLVRRPFRHKAGASGRAELAALQQAPDDRDKAVALAKALLARSAGDEDFRRALESWWEQAEPIRSGTGNVTNTISGGTQHGPVLQGRDFGNITFGAPPPS